MKKHIAIIIVIIIVAIGLGIWLSKTSDKDPLPEEVAGEMITSLAPVEAVEILVMESFPVQVQAVGRGNYPNGCSSAGDVTTVFDPATKTFRVEFLMEQPQDAMCTQALVPFEQTVVLDVLDLPAGTYSVDFNGVLEQFTLDVDNTMGFEDKS